MGKDLKGKELGVGLTQRKDGKYSAKVKLSNGQRPEKYFTKLKDAREWVARTKYLDEELINGCLTVNEWYKFWIKNYKENVTKNNTVKNYKNRYKKNIRDEIGELKLFQVKQAHCQKILNNMNGKYAEGTIELTKITLHALFDAAVANTYITVNPATHIKIPKQDPRDERRVLSVEEQKEFLLYAENTQYGNAYKLALQTGLRTGEIGGLQWKDIDFEKKTLSVERTLLQQKSKGGFYFGSPKTTTSRRKVPLTEEAVRILENQRIKQKKMQLTAKEWDGTWDGLVFTTIHGKPVGESTFRILINKIVANINLDRKLAGRTDMMAPIYMHALRHTFATRCIESGVKPKVLQKILGHSSINVTMDLYVHVSDELYHEEIEKINIRETGVSGLVKCNEKDENRVVSVS